MQMKYEREMYKIVEDESNVSFFCKLLTNEMRSEPAEYFKLINDLLEFFELNCLETAKAWVNYYLGWYYNDKSQFDKSVDIFLNAYNTFESTNNKRGMAYICNGLSSAYFDMGQHKLSCEWSLKGTALAEEAKDMRMLVMLLINTAICYVTAGSFDKADEIFAHVDRMEYKLTSSLKVSRLLAVAEIEISRANYDKAEAHIAEVLKLEEDCGRVSAATRAETSLLLGRIHTQKGDYLRAYKELWASIDYARQAESVSVECNSRLCVAKLKIAECQYDEALQLLGNVALIAEKAKLSITMRNVNYEMYIVQKSMGNCMEALKNLESYVQLDKTISEFQDNQIISYINTRQMEKEINVYKRLYDNNKLLSRIGQKIISTFDINLMTKIVSSELDSIMHMDLFGLAVYSADDDSITYTYSFKNGTTVTSKPFSMKGNDVYTFSRIAIETGRPINIGNIDDEQLKITMTYRLTPSQTCHIKSLLTIPLTINDMLVGAATVQSSVCNAYGENDINALTIISNYIAIAIENSTLYKQVHDRAVYDSLTGFLTRFEIMKTGESLYEEYRCKNQPLGIAMIDIDNFKFINDTYGHASGDKILSEVANIIGKAVDCEHLGRYGGDEFLLICPGCNSTSMQNTADMITQMLSESEIAVSDGATEHISVSIGTYAFTDYSKTLKQGIDEADKKMYSNKKKH